MSPTIPSFKIPDDFTDFIFEKPHFNLRKLTALLRIADETDEPYIRSTPSQKSLRDGISLVEIEGTNIIVYWDRATNTDPDDFKDFLNRKIGILKDSIQYFDSIGSFHWNFYCRPEFSTKPAFMPEKPVETFVGRVPDLENLHNILRTRGAGAVTGLRGAGGIGKTELARMYAQKYRNEYPGGVFWASLKASTWKEEAGKIKVCSILSGLSSRFPDKEKAIESLLKGVLNRKDALLIIDNVDDAEDIITPACFVLVTTRDESILHKKLSREAIYELKQLPDNDGIELLGKVIGQKRIDDDRAGALRLVEILGGMPLALDIAAKHLREAPH